MSESNKLLSITPNIMVEDVNKTIDYYRDNFDFKPMMTVPESGDFTWAMLHRDNVTLMLQKKSSLIEEYSILKDRTLGGSLSLFIKVSNIQKLYESLKQNNVVKLLKNLGMTTYGMQEFAVIDLNGYVLTFAEE